MNIPLTADHYDPARDCAPSQEGDCILAAIERFSVILADPSRPSNERAEALRFLVHFVADLHQPLHTTTNNDRGGNDTAVTFFGQPTNLHAVWDYGLMEHTGLTVTAWTNLLNRSRMSEDARGTPVAWAEESVRVAAEHAYRLPANHELGQAYVDANLPIVREQLLRAGVQLAGLLNAIFERTTGGIPSPGSACATAPNSPVFPRILERLSARGLGVMALRKIACGRTSCAC